MRRRPALRRPHSPLFFPGLSSSSVTAKKPRLWERISAQKDYLWREQAFHSKFPSFLPQKIPSHPCGPPACFNCLCKKLNRRSLPQRSGRGGGREPCTCGNFLCPPSTPPDIPRTVGSCRERSPSEKVSVWENGVFSRPLLICERRPGPALSGWPTELGASGRRFLPIVLHRCCTIVRIVLPVPVRFLEVP